MLGDINKHTVWNICVALQSKKRKVELGCLYPQTKKRKTKHMEEMDLPLEQTNEVSLAEMDALVSALFAKKQEIDRKSVV